MAQLCRTAAVFLAASFLVFGCKGPDGARGADGAQGPPGAPGSNGKDGLPGADGKNGKDGKDGKDGTNAPKGDKWGVADSNPPGLVGRAVLPAATFAPGPPSGEITGGLWSSQPVQGFSSLVDLGDGSRYTGTQFTYQYAPRGVSIGEFILFANKKGIIIERDGTQGDVNGWKRLFQVELPAGTSGAVTKTDLVNLNAIPDTLGISTGTGLAGDVGLGNPFSFPFTTIESVLVLGPRLLAVTNDNNYPGSIGRHTGLGLPDDNEFILVKLDHDLY